MSDPRLDSEPGTMERLQGEAKRAWDSLPPARRDELLNVLGLTPRDLKGWRRLIDQVVDHVRIATGDKRQVAIVGPANVGKSTLYNALIRSKSDRAQVSPIPGTTRRSRQADAGLFVVIDTPGADAPGPVGVEEAGQALTSARAADLLVVLFDATHGVRVPEQALFRDLRKLGKPTVVALNKMDLVGEDRAEVIGQAAASLGISSDQLTPISAKDEEGIERMLLAIARSEPGIVAALGEALPEYRWDLAQAVIARAGSTAAAIAVTPLPFLDFFPLVGVQSAMVLGVARLYTYRITPARARELIATFGVGLLGRSLFYELSKLSGPPGWLISAGVAAGTTVALGYAAAIWFDRGEKLSAKVLGRVSKAVGATVIERLKDVGRRKPKRVTLRQRVSEILESLEAEGIEDALEHDGDRPS